jgi:hypothetical protein
LEAVFFGIALFFTRDDSMSKKLTKRQYQLVRVSMGSADRSHPLVVTMPTEHHCDNVARDLARQRISEQHNETAGPDDITTTRDSFSVTDWDDDSCTVSYDGVVVAWLYRLDR